MRRAGAGEWAKCKGWTRCCRGRIAFAGGRGYRVEMPAVTIGFVWGAFFGTVVLMLAGALAAFAQSHHRVALSAALTALLSALFIASYLAGLPVADRDLERRLVAHVGLVCAVLLQLMLMLDLGLLRERDTRRRILAGVAVLVVLTAGGSWLLEATDALLLGSCVSFGLAVAALLTAIRSVWRGDRLAWNVLWGVLLLPVCVAGVSWIALDPAGVPWIVHAVSALAGMAFLAGVGAMLWMRYSYLIELRDVQAQGPRYDPITRMPSSLATGYLLGQAFARQRHTPARPLVLIAVSIGNLYALENLHGRGALNHALFVCATRLRRSVPAEMEIGRLFDDGFLLISRNAGQMERLVRMGRRLADRLSAPITVRTDAAFNGADQARAEWAAQVGVGLLAATAQGQAGTALAMVRDMSRTAWTYGSRVAWHDDASGAIAEVPALEPVR